MCANTSVRCLYMYLPQLVHPSSFWLATKSRQRSRRAGSTWWLARVAAITRMFLCSLWLCHLYPGQVDTQFFFLQSQSQQFFHHQDGTITSWRYSDLLLLHSMVSHFPGPSRTLTFSFPFLTPATGTQGSPLLQTAAEAFHAGPGLGAGTQDG